MRLAILAPPWLLFSCCLAKQSSQILGGPFSLGSSGSAIQHTLDSIIPTTDPNSGRVKCCPIGTDFDGKSCIITGPSCPPGTYRKGKHCLHNAPPECANGYEYSDGQCTSRKPPACDHGTVLVGKHCVHERAPTCGEGFQLRGAICESLKKPQCLEGDVVHGASCVTPEGPSCPNGSKVEGASCISKKDPQCPPGARYVSSSRQCMSEKSPQCPDGATLEFGQCTSSEGPKCQGDSTFDPERGSCTVSSKPQCPGETTLQGQSCVDVSEANGWMLEADQCVKRGVPNCPNNTYPDGDTCVSTLEAPGCPEGYLYHDSKCILRSSPTCTGKTILEGDKCVSYAKPTCDDQNVREECSTMAPASSGASLLVLKALLLMASGVYPSRTPRSAHLAQCSTRKGNASLPFKPLVHHQQSTETAVVFMVSLHAKLDGKTLVKGTCVSIEKETCKPGYVLKDGQCVSALPPSCGENQVFNGTGCMGVTPDCPENTYFENGECVSSNDPKCDANFVFNGKSCVAVKEPTCSEGHVYNAVTGECFAKAVPECQEDEVLEDGRCKLVTAPCVEYKFCLAGAQGLISGSGGLRKPAGDSKDKSQKPLTGKPSSSEDVSKGAPDGTQDSIPVDDPISNNETAKRDTQAGKDSTNLADKEQPDISISPGAETNSGNTGTVPDSNVQVPDPATIPKGGSGGRENRAGADGSTEPQYPPSGEGEASYAGHGSGSGASGAAEDGVGREKGGKWVEYEEEIPDRRKLRKWIADDDADAHGGIPSGQGGTGGLPSGGLPSGGQWKLDVDMGSLPDGPGGNFRAGGGEPDSQQVPAGQTSEGSQLWGPGKMKGAFADWQKSAEGIQKPAADVAGDSQMWSGGTGQIPSGGSWQYKGGSAGAGSYGTWKPTGDASSESYYSRLKKGGYGSWQGGGGAETGSGGTQRPTGDASGETYYSRLKKGSYGSYKG
ncbi:hypothetical protein GCG54_00006024 [Colletotrichum gloeosporioides]|uniref:Uncharacterized protein n=1 Tax=Colletotrichum gloeosporioides TaxID=474922 RepID=A0A8H4CM87_COLGL|nr:uncharacterized protein GCG54_00006024 [Colletotrichum gloeosporioides]KAF3806262.1 hypothetical protein GCG54_00006024 [Colletotrichum gloeosporioides]